MIPQYKTILCATAMSPRTKQTFCHALALARALNARIVILHVLLDTEPSAVINLVATIMGEDRLADLEIEHKSEVIGKMKQVLEEFAREELVDHPEDMERVAGFEVHHGSPVQVIIKTAERLGADLIVMGNHTKFRVTPPFLGNVTEKVLHKSRIPVLIVPKSI
jgi:nucleotide-binding universal stress UspA family protein